MLLALTAASTDALIARDRPPAAPLTAGSRPPPLAFDDADRDGIADARESALAARYAPVVLLADSDRYRPASVDWLLARLPSKAGTSKQRLAASLGKGGDAFSPEVRQGSRDPRDWVTYLHAYLRSDGGINLQYWFFYPFNDGLVLFDHEGDWERVTVQLDRGGDPSALLLAQHGDTRPGARRSWSEVERLGDHPIIWSARGTHASYPDRASVPWFERVSPCAALAGCPGPVWRTWEGGGLRNVGERDALLGPDDAFAYDGRWGGLGVWFGARPPPHGPVHQRRSFENAGFN